MQSTRNHEMEEEEQVIHIQSSFIQAGGPLPITALESSGINASLIKKLQEAGYYTVESVFMIPLDEHIGCFYNPKEIN